MNKISKATSPSFVFEIDMHLDGGKISTQELFVSSNQGKDFFLNSPLSSC